ncbi:hypothetical protein LAZ67_1004266 [Cordylochernes scorpioides]|uniref:Uncharacterized protein n=1 Tax=Cordylochernes scorpioides TaxID=51811 RepID=A0ABY6JZ43_9ARAC|nr:hypothetical protein LAZ67_1004266 [Cordylochernes scorpioides]
MASRARLQGLTPRGRPISPQASLRELMIRKGCSQSYRFITRSTKRKEYTKWGLAAVGRVLDAVDVTLVKRLAHIVLVQPGLQLFKLNNVKQEIEESFTNYFSTAWDSTTKSEKTLANLISRLSLEETKQK